MRCHRSMVSGSTTLAITSSVGHSRTNQTSNALSQLRSLSRRSSATEFDFALNLHGNIEWKFSEADGGPGVSSDLLAEELKN